jgi:hypothetical protein
VLQNCLNITIKKCCTRLARTNKTVHQAGTQLGALPMAYTRRSPKSFPTQSSRSGGCLWSVGARLEVWMEICIPRQHRSRTVIKDEFQIMLAQGMLEECSSQHPETHKDEPFLADTETILSNSSSRHPTLLSLFISRPPRHLFPLLSLCSSLTTTNPSR